MKTSENAPSSAVAVATYVAGNDGERDTGKYEVMLIRPRDGKEFSEHARKYLERTGCMYDATLNGYVAGEIDSGLPLSYSIFLPANNLEVVNATVDYDPEWFSEPEGPQTFEDIAIPWDGLPPCGEGKDFYLCHCIAPGAYDGLPFVASWKDDRWYGYSSEPGMPGLSSEEVVAAGWIFAATISEAVDMGYRRIDRANARRLSRQAREAIINDVPGCALQVALATGRIQISEATATFTSRENKLR